MNNIIVYLRFLSKNKVLSAINVIGLSVGIATCIFIGVYVKEELSYDRYHSKLDRIFSVTTKLTTDQSLDHLAIASLPLAAELKQHYPEVEEAVRLKQMFNPTVGYQGTFFKENEIYEADAEVFTVFSYTLLKGNPTTALTGIHNIVITQSFSKKYFGAADPIGKSLLINTKEYLVTGVLEDLPSNSDVKFSALISIDKTHDTDWFWDFAYTYVLFQDNYLLTDSALKSFEVKLAKIADAKINEAFKSSNQSTRMNLAIEPLKDSHFRKPLYGDTPKGNLNYLYVLSSVALLMLIIGSINFINFSLVQSLQRGKEVGIRKVIGANYRQLVFRYLSESLMITLIAFILATLLVVVGLPLFNSLTGKTFQLHHLINLQFLGYSVLTILLLGTLAGSYPAFFTSSIQPLQSLKGKVAGVKGILFRKFSIATQFAIAIGLILCTSLIYQQMEFISHFDLGFKKDNILVIDAPIDSVYSRKLDAFKQSLLQNASVQRVSNLGYSGLPGETPNKTNVRTKVDGEAKIINFSWVDEEYLPTLDIQLVQGRNFEATRESDKKKAVLVNESFVKLWGWENPLQEKIQWEGEEVNVIGVIKDFHFSSLHTSIEPHFLVLNNKEIVNTLVRFDKTYSLTKQQELLKNVWSEHLTDQPLVYHFLEEDIATQYKSEQQALKIFTTFSFLTIAVSCLGLFGLCSLVISQRKKEVGIRRIVGANFRSLVTLFSKEYVLLIFIAFIVVTPFTIMAMNQWLATFPVKEEIGLSLFIWTGMSVMSLALLTIAVSIGKTSMSNPVTLLRE